MFKKWRKQRKCVHEYHLLGTFRKWTGSEYIQCVKVYCPKCERTTTGQEYEWVHQQVKQRVREEYRKRNSNVDSRL